MDHNSGPRQFTVIICALVGAVVGLFLAIVPLFVLMEISFRMTGYDAGNAGVFLCCTVPTFPVIGAVAGMLIATRSGSS